MKSAEEWIFELDANETGFAVCTASEIVQIQADAVKCVWHKGIPSKCYGEEWFIACLDNGDRVVLRSLPEEFSYDYTTADDTYYKKHRIEKWMQFPDSHFFDYQRSKPEHIAGHCQTCGEVVYHRDGKPGEYNHQCKPSRA